MFYITEILFEFHIRKKKCIVYLILKILIVEPPVSRSGFHQNIFQPCITTSKDPRNLDRSNDRDRAPSSSSTWSKRKRKKKEKIKKQNIVDRNSLERLDRKTVNYNSRYASDLSPVRVIFRAIFREEEDVSGGNRAPSLHPEMDLCRCRCRGGAHGCCCLVGASSM